MAPLSADKRWDESAYSTTFMAPGFRNYSLPPYAERHFKMDAASKYVPPEAYQEAAETGRVRRARWDYHQGSADTGWIVLHSSEGGSEVVLPYHFLPGGGLQIGGQTLSPEGPAPRPNQGAVPPGPIQGDPEPVSALMGTWHRINQLLPGEFRLPPDQIDFSRDGRFSARFHSPSGPCSVTGSWSLEPSGRPSGEARLTLNANPCGGHSSVLPPASFISSDGGLLAFHALGGLTYSRRPNDSTPLAFGDGAFQVRPSGRFGPGQPQTLRVTYSRSISSSQPVQFTLTQTPAQWMGTSASLGNPKTLVHRSVAFPASGSLTLDVSANFAPGLSRLEFRFDFPDETMPRLGTLSTSLKRVSEDASFIITLDNR